MLTHLFRVLLAIFALYDCLAFWPPAPRRTSRAFVTSAGIPLKFVLLVVICTVHLPYGFGWINLVAVTPAGPQFGPPGQKSQSALPRLP
jgi:hypothetical protein